MKDKNIIYIIVLASVLCFSVGLISGILQGKDLRTFYVNELEDCRNRTTHSSGYYNYNIDSQPINDDLMIDLDKSID